MVAVRAVNINAEASQMDVVGDITLLADKKIDLSKSKITGNSKLTIGSNILELNQIKYYKFNLLNYKEDLNHLY